MFNDENRNAIRLEGIKEGKATAARCGREAAREFLVAPNEVVLWRGKGVLPPPKEDATFPFDGPVSVLDKSLACRVVHCTWGVVNPKTKNFVKSWYGREFGSILGVESFPFELCFPVRDQSFFENVLKLIASRGTNKLRAWVEFRGQEYTFYLIGSLCQDLTEVDSVNVHAMRAVMIALTPLQELEQQLKVLDTHAVFNPLRLYRLITRPPAAVTEKEIALATHAGMKAKLRPHQVRAVCWAIDVERNGLDLSTWWQNAHRDVLLPLPATSDRDSILFHPLTGQLFSLGDMKMPVLPKVYGGMLCDEMGLGKTVEVLALVLAHVPRLAKNPPVRSEDNESFKDLIRCFCGHSSKLGNGMVKCASCNSLQHACCVGYPEKDYACPNCLEETGVKIPIRASVVVTPQAILHQWVDEIKKHAPSLKVLVYEGVSKVQKVLTEQVSKQKKGACPIIACHQLSQFDIILVSYQTLRAEQGHVEIKQRVLRNPSRFPRIPCPLLHGHFARVCLDEAQMVGGGGAVHQAAQLALSLSAEHRWCVSGTPFKRSPADIDGLLKFLRVPFLSVPRYFDAFLGNPLLTTWPLGQTRMADMLNHIMWRTCKKDAELGIAKPIEVIRVIDFSVHERIHYLQLYDSCLAQFGQNFAPARRNLYGKKVNTIQNEIVRLRHACDHFQLGEQGLRLVGNEGRKTHIVKETLTLDDLQDSLVQQELNRYTALVRKVLRGKAHCAGVLMLSNEFERAVVLYDEVLTFGLNEKDCKVDSTILIHSAHNLLEAVKLAGRHAPKVNVDVAKKMLAGLEVAFLDQARQDARESFNALQALRANVDGFKHGSWWEDTLKAMTATEISDFLMRLSVNASRSSILSDRIAAVTTAEGIRGVIMSLKEDLLRARSSVLLASDKLAERSRRDPTHSEMQRQRECGHCHKFSDDLVRPPCDLCRFEIEHVRAYEGVLFFFDESICPGCAQLVALNQVSLGEDEKDKIVYTEDELNAKSVKELKILCVENNVHQGKKKDMVAALLEVIGPDFVKANSSHCSKCRRWWHLRCLPKEVQKMFRLVDKMEDWQCPVCLNLVIVDGAAGAGRIRHPGLYNQMLLSLKRYFNKHFNRGDDDNEDDEELGQVVANDLKFFNLLEAEMQGLTKIFTSLHFVVGSHDALIKVKSRVRVAKDNEKVAEVDKDEEMAAEALLESDLEVVKRTTVSSIIKNLELLLGKLELERKQSLSSYRFLKNDDASGECTICYDDLGASDLVILPCNHKFHYNCHLEWEKRSDAPQCAMCRAPAPKNELQRVRDNSIQVKKRVESENSKPVDPIMSSLRLEGMSAKLAAVVKELKSCAAWNEPARIVLFSQFAEMLPVIYNACTVNGLHEFICYGKTAAQLSKSIDVFKSRCKKERFVVLLLPISKGAEGLTLTEANAVFLLEPTFPAALEQQAVARIDRIGQMHQKLMIYRFVVRNTVEQRLLELSAQEVENAKDAEELVMSDEMSRQILERPNPLFQFGRNDNEEGFDEDEVWWNQMVGGKTRREHLEPFLLNDAGEDYELLHGVEVPSAAVPKILGLKKSKIADE